MAKLSPTIIEAAIAGFEAQKKAIDGQIAELRGMLTGEPQAEEAPAKGIRRKRSAAVRARMKAAQQARWAKIKGGAAPAKAVTVTAKPKRKLSAAGRKAISAAMKKRWAAKKAAA